MSKFLPCQLYIFEAIDHGGFQIDNNQYQVDKSLLPTIIYLKLEILVELIASNLDTHDGLVNGADGIFQMHTTEQENIIWIQFNDSQVGTSHRKKMQ